jgi:hypothetical protein
VASLAIIGCISLCRSATTPVVAMRDSSQVCSDLCFTNTPLSAATNDSMRPGWVSLNPSDAAWSSAAAAGLPAPPNFPPFWHLQPAGYAFVGGRQPQPQPRRVDDRRVISGIIDVVQVACQWQDRATVALRQPSTIGFIVGRCADGSMVSAQDLILPKIRSAVEIHPATAKMNHPGSLRRD